MVSIGYSYLGDYAINAALAPGSKTIMATLFLDMVLIGPRGMVTRSLPNWLGRAQTQAPLFYLNECVWRSGPAGREMSHVIMELGELKDEGFYSKMFRLVCSTFVKSVHACFMH